MIHTDLPEHQKAVDVANRLLRDWHYYILKEHERYRGCSLRLYISPQLWHDFLVLEFGQYNDDHLVKMYGRNVHVYLVYGVDYDHSYLTYSHGC